MPAASRACETCSTIESGATTAIVPSLMSSVSDLVAAATPASRSSGAVCTNSGAWSLWRTLVGARNVGVAANITWLASAMIWAGMRYPTLSPITRDGF